MIEVEVVFAEAGRAVVRTFRVEEPASVADVLRLAAATDDFAGVLSVHPAVGIFGRRADAGEPVEDGDRIEIYRALAADPKNARRARARALSRSGRS
jgi:putative ubiquitin-RnfH superfamily antitoxin RatB of RatAB toxin-antitoxin module